MKSANANYFDGIVLKNEAEASRKRLLRVGFRPHYKSGNYERGGCEIWKSSRNTIEVNITPDGDFIY